MGTTATRTNSTTALAAANPMTAGRVQPLSSRWRNGPEAANPAIMKGSSSAAEQRVRPDRPGDGE
ncbi:MAG: hypothetical protein ACRDRK_10090 [Pseudonocardia sp.]